VRALRERRGLSGAGSSCRLEFLFQPLVLAPQAIVLTFDALQLSPQLRDLPLVLRRRPRRLARGIRALGQPPVMPESLIPYKYKKLIESI
jgi:hypothetical protein